MAFVLKMCSLYLIKSYLRMHLELLNCSRKWKVVGNIRDPILGMGATPGAASFTGLLNSDGFEQQVIYLLSKNMYVCM